MLFPIIVLVHLLLIAFILSVRSGAMKSGEAAPALSLIDIAGPKEKAAVEPVEQPNEVIAPEPLVKLPTTSEIPAGPVFDVSAASAAGFGKSCEISEALGRAFQSHEALRQALADWPPQARSVSGAVMLWDGAWVEPDAAINPVSLALIQRGVIEGIKAAPAECLDEPIIGPRLVIVPSPDGRNSVLVLGSGNWAWRDILDYEDERLRTQLPVGAAEVPRAPEPAETNIERLWNSVARVRRNPPEVARAQIR